MCHLMLLVTAKAWAERVTDPWRLHEPFLAALEG